MKKNLKLAGALTALCLTSACSMNSPTWVNQSRVEVHANQFTDTFETAKLDDAVIRAIAVYHYRYGNGPVTMVVGYDRNSKVNTEAKAKAEAARIKSALQRNGVKDVYIETAYLVDTGDVSVTTVTFPALVAKAPAKCGMIPGYNSPTTGYDSADGIAPYELGCTVETLMAKQIARPGDLLGRPGFETNADGRRQETVTSERGYYGSKSNEPLEGESSSGTR